MKKIEKKEKKFTYSYLHTLQIQVLVLNMPWSEYNNSVLRQLLSCAKILTQMLL